MVNTSFLMLLSEKTKTILTVVAIVLLIFIVLFLVLGLIGKLIESTMKLQGKKVDRYMTNVVISRICDNPKEFNKIARLKNKICFFRSSIAPIIIGILTFLTWVIYHAVIGGEWDQSIFDTKTGIASLFYIFDFSKTKYVPPLGFDGIEIINKPHFVEGPAITNYFIFTFGLIAIIWYLVNVQSYVARLYRIKKLKETIYSKDLSQIDITHFYNLNKVNPHSTNVNSNQNQPTEINIGDKK